MTSRTRVSFYDFTDLAQAANDKEGKGVLEGEESEASIAESLSSYSKAKREVVCKFAGTLAGLVVAEVCSFFICYCRIFLIRCGTRDDEDNWQLRSDQPPVIKSMDREEIKGKSQTLAGSLSSQKRSLICSKNFLFFSKTLRVSVIFKYISNPLFISKVSRFIPNTSLRECQR